MIREKTKKLIILALELILVILNKIFLSEELWGINPSLGWLQSYANLFSIFSFLIGGIPIIYESLHAAFHKDFTADILFSIALVAEFFLQQFLAIGILLLMMGAGEYLEEFTIEKAHGNLNDLLKNIPKKAMVMQYNHDQTIQKFSEIAINDIHEKDIVQIKEGGCTPVDGIIIKGFSNVDLSSLTGESLPVFLKENDWIPSGALVLDGYIEYRCQNIASESYIEKVITLVKNAQDDKSHFQNLVNHWAQFFAPTIIILATIIGLLTQSLYTAVSVLTVSCPCSLVLSVPTAFVASFANASRHKIWIKSGDALEKLAKIDTVMFDKTGTLTTGNMQIQRIKSMDENMTEDKILSICVSLEYQSNHPIARAILNEATKRKIETQSGLNIENLRGIGVRGKIPDINSNDTDEQNTLYILGNTQLLEKQSPAMMFNKLNSIENLINFERIKQELLSEDFNQNLNLILHNSTKILAIVSLNDVTRQNIKKTITGLRTLGITRIGLLTGDSEERSTQFSKDLDFDVIYSGLTPDEKYQKIQDEKKTEGLIAMVGDGINDAPSLALADIGIAVGQTATPLTTDQADVVLTDANLMNIPQAIKIGRRTIGKGKFNILLAILFNTVGISLSIIFFKHYHAASWHIFQSIFVVLNSVLLLDDPRQKKKD